MFTAIKIRMIIIHIYHSVTQLNDQPAKCPADQCNNVYKLSPQILNKKMKKKEKNILQNVYRINNNQFYNRKICILKDNINCYNVSIVQMGATINFIKCSLSIRARVLGISKVKSIFNQLRKYDNIK